MGSMASAHLVFGIDITDIFVEEMNPPFDKYRFELKFHGNVYRDEPRVFLVLSGHIYEASDIRDDFTEVQLNTDAYDVFRNKFKNFTIEHKLDVRKVGWYLLSNYC